RAVPYPESIDRTAAVTQGEQLPVLTSSDTPFGHVGQKSDQTSVLQLSPGGQPIGTEVHAGDGPGLGHPTANPRVSGRHRPTAQSSSSGLDRVLWTVYALGIGTPPAVCQSDAAGLGHAEVQELWGPQDQG